MSCNCTDLNNLVNQSNSILGGCYPTPTFSSGGSYSGVLLTGSTFTAGTITSSVFSGGAITGSSVRGLPEPTLAGDAVTKSYADGLSFLGLDIHGAVKAATTGNITLSGGAPSTLDGIALAANDRVLVKDQTNGIENGIYYVSTLGSGANGTWARAADASTSGSLQYGSSVQVLLGTANGSSEWVVTTLAVVVGTSAIDWTLRFGVSSISAAKVSGQLTDAQIAGLSASKLTGTLAIPLDVGAGYFRTQIQTASGLTVGSAFNVGANGTADGVAITLLGNGHRLVTNAPTAALPVTLRLQNTAATTTVTLSSDGTILSTGNTALGGNMTVGGTLQVVGNVLGGLTLTGTLQSLGLYVTGNGVVDGDLYVTTGDLTVVAGNIVASAGFITTSGVSILANDVYAPAGTVTGLNLQVANNIILTGKTITPAGTTGARTINELSGSVNMASGASSLVVTNSLVNANSVILISKAHNDNARLGAVEASAGFFTIYMDTAPSGGECRINFLVTN